MDTFRLNVRFGGMCAFVPQRVGDKQRMWVFLIDARQPPKEIPEMKPHSPVVQFQLGDVAGVSSPPSSAKGIFQLDEYDLSIETGTNDEDKELTITGFTGAPLAVPDLTGAIDETHFGWVASIPEACTKRGLKDGGKVKPELLHDTIPGFHNKGIVGRILLKEGTIQAGRIVQYENRRIVWKFRPPGQGDDPRNHRQFIATGISLDIDVKQPTVDISAMRFDGGNRVKLTLRPAGGAFVGVDILNEESDQLIGIQSPPPVQPEVERPEDRMVALYRPLVVQPPAFPDFPIPVAERLDPPPISKPITWGSPPCASVRLEA